MAIKVNYAFDWEDNPQTGGAWVKAIGPFGVCEIVQMGDQFQWFALGCKGSEDTLDGAKLAVQRQLETFIRSIVEVTD